VGKSTLLDIFQIMARREGAAGALVQAEQVRSIPDLLAAWASALELAEVRAPLFRRRFEKYQTITQKVLYQAQQERQKEANARWSRAAEGVASAASQVAASAASGAMVPGLGPFLGAAVGAGSEYFLEWLRGFLSREDVELYVEPAEKLTSMFLQDLSATKPQRTLVLMVDTYEQLGEIDAWIRKLAPRLPPHVVLLLAGRTVPRWITESRTEPGALSIVEMKAMDVNDLRLLVQRHFRHIRGYDPSPEQVENAARFARGLPLAATTLVRLWVTYSEELSDFRIVAPRVIADLAKYLLDGVPPEVRDVFQAAAIVRFFNADILSELLGRDAGTDYSLLQDWPFIRPRREGFAVHDAMREWISEELRQRTPKRYSEMHRRAAEYHRARMLETVGEANEVHSLECVFHLIHTGSEVDAVQVSRSAIEVGVSAHLSEFPTRMLALLDDSLDKEGYSQLIA
jgi:hypothetical protein